MILSELGDEQPASPVCVKHQVVEHSDTGSRVQVFWPVRIIVVLLHQPHQSVHHVPVLQHALAIFEGRGPEQKPLLALLLAVGHPAILKGWFGRRPAVQGAVRAGKREERSFATPQPHTSMSSATA